MADPKPYVARLIPSLLAVPGTQPGVCECCHSSTDSHSRCAQCARAMLDFGVLPDILPIALMTSESPLYEALRGYKGGAGESVRTAHRRTSAALLATFIRSHRSCIGQFDSVTAIPSQTRVAVHELIQLISGLREHYTEALAPVGLWAPRELRADRYSVTRDMTGERILVVDDTFTSGATVFSACETLRQAGATVVGPVVIGRFLRLGWEPSDRLHQQLSRTRWEDSACLRCSGGVHFGDSLLF
jgi:predicted amidophosphoribosyltransferase